MAKKKRPDASGIRPDDDDTVYISPKAWCDTCRRNVEFVVHKTRKYGLWQGARYRYKGKKANCCECGATIILPEIIEYNLRAVAKEAAKPKYKEMNSAS